MLRLFFRYCNGFYVAFSVASHHCLREFRVESSYATYDIRLWNVLWGRNKKHCFTNLGFIYIYILVTDNACFLSALVIWKYLAYMMPKINSRLGTCFISNIFNCNRMLWLVTMPFPAPVMTRYTDVGISIIHKKLFFCFFLDFLSNLSLVN